jgi:hypothetical protein
MYVTSASYSSDGSQIIAGCSDGSIQLFHEKYKYGKPLQVGRPGHGGCEVSDVKFILGDTQIISRGFDDCIKIWDLRKLKSGPVNTVQDVDTDRSGSNTLTSHNGQIIMAGTSKGELVTVRDGVVEDRRKFPAKSFIRLIESPTGEVFATTSDGNVFVWYGDDLVAKWRGASGAPIAIRSETTTQIDYNIYSYDDLLQGGKYRENRQGDIREVFLKKSFVPPPGSQPDVSGPRENIDDLHERISKVDNRQVPLSSIQKHLLSFDPSLRGEEEEWVGAAYKKTQPKPILDYSNVAGTADSLLTKKAYCPRCGLKMCTCGFLDNKRQRL